MRFFVVAIVLAALMLVASRSRVPDPSAYLRSRAAAASGARKRPMSSVPRPLAWHERSAGQPASGIRRCRRSTAPTYSSTRPWIVCRTERVSFIMPTT